MTAETYNKLYSALQTTSKIGYVNKDVARRLLNKLSKARLGKELTLEPRENRLLFRIKSIYEMMIDDEVEWNGIPSYDNKYSSDAIFDV